MSNLQKIVVLCIVGCIILVGGFFVLNSYIYEEKQTDDAEEISAVEQPEVASEAVLSEESLVDVDASNPETFNTERVMKIVPFTDSSYSKKNLVLTFDETYVTGRNLYLADENINEQTATKVLNIGFAVEGESPFVSPSEGKKYIVVERSGPGDTQNLIMLSEDGSVIANTMDSEFYPDLSGYLVSFIRWESTNTFSAKALSHAEGPPTLQLLVDAKTGEILNKDLQE